MPQVPFCVPVMEDGILYNLPNIEGYVLDDGVIEQGTLGCHLTHVCRRNETRRDEVMSHLGNIGQMFGLEVDGVPFAIEFPLTPPIGQDLEDLRVVGPLMEPIKRLGGNRVKIIELVNRLHAEVYQHPTHPYLFHDMGGEVGVEFSYHTHRSWTRWLEKRPPSLIRYGLAKEVVGVVEALFFYEGPIFTNGAKPIGCTFIDKPSEVEIRCRFLIGPTPFSGQLLSLTRNRCRGVGLDLLITKGRTGAEWHKGGHS